jgi:hypothetical protein
MFKLIKNCYTFGIINGFIVGLAINKPVSVHFKEKFKPRDKTTDKFIIGHDQETGQFCYSGVSRTVGFGFGFGPSNSVFVMGVVGGLIPFAFPFIIYNYFSSVKLFEKITLTPHETNEEYVLEIEYN